VLSIEEKPTAQKIKLCSSGFVFFTITGYRFCKKIAPSARGEYEITDVNKEYRVRAELKVGFWILVLLG
jgi:glucose-1-phosphate thymidylyltransferase